MTGPPAEHTAALDHLLAEALHTADTVRFNVLERAEDRTPTRYRVNVFVATYGFVTVEDADRVVALAGGDAAAEDRDRWRPVTPAEEMRAAAKRIRIELPPHWRHAPRLVQTDSESIDGIAFCPKPHETSGEYEFADCDWCEVIESHHEKIAELIVALLLAREPLAEWLGYRADCMDAMVNGVSKIPERVAAATPENRLALQAARAINGGAQ